MTCNNIYGDKKPTSELDPKLEKQHPTLEDFNIGPPSIRFYNFEKLSSTAENVRKLQLEIKNFKPTDMPQRYLGSIKSNSNNENNEKENQNAENLSIFPIENIERIPPIAPQLSEEFIPKGPNFEKIVRRHILERIRLSEDYRKEQNQLNLNHYDAIIRENLQKNDINDKRPIAEALRFISKKISYPIDNGWQRFYKYTFRTDKILKKFTKLAKNIDNSYYQRSEILYHSQFNEIISQCDIEKLDSRNISISKLIQNNPSE